MTAQRALLVLAILAGAVSGAIYYSASERAGVVFASAHLSPGRPIAESDVEVRWLPADAVPAGALTETAAAIGHFPRAPIWPGQVLIAGSLARTTATFESGLVPPTGYRALAIPVTAHQALGGAIAPGARVDVIAVPLPGGEQDEGLAELLTEAALVIDVRGEHGGPIARDESGPALTVRERLGSVVIAVAASEELMIAERIARSSFVLVLVPPFP